MRSPECGAVQVVASGERALQVGQPDELQIGVQTAAAVLDGDVDPHRDHQSVVGPQLVPGVAVDTVSLELIMVAPEQRLLQPSPFGDGPVKNSRVDQVVDTEPGGQAPVERLSVDQVDSRTRRGTRMLVQPGSPWMIVNPSELRVRSMIAAGCRAMT